MHAKFLEGSRFSFNYNTLLLIASVIAACGLAGNSVAAVIASMLVSPLMGPVVGMAYAYTIHDYKMFRIALTTEIISLVACIITGVLVAACMLPFDISETWPTDEMYGRGTMANLWLGFPIAFFSGLGVAVGLLDEQTSSLVGVAISASLLPPAVNCGMVWISYFAYNPESRSFGYDVSRSDFAKWGWTSLGLTFVNIVLIIIASMFMVSRRVSCFVARYCRSIDPYNLPPTLHFRRPLQFRLKERLPINKSIFWSDLGLARKIYRNLAIIPRIQQGPTQQDIQKRVTMLIGRPSTVNFGSYDGSLPRDSITPKMSRKSKFHVPHGDAVMQSIVEDQTIMETIGEANEGGDDGKV
jgi:uncharacterized hydrophobic protein (TIGR00271 family)